MTTGGTHDLLPTATGLAARRAIAALRERNIDPTPLLRHVGLFEQDLKERLDRVSAAAQARLLELAADALNDRALGFHLATETNPRGAGLLFYVASAAKDLGEALGLFARYCQIVNKSRLNLRPPTATPALAPPRAAFTNAYARVDLTFLRFDLGVASRE